MQACVLAYALVRLIEDRLDAAGLDQSAKEALQRLDNIHHLTVHLGGISLERTSIPTPEQATTLRALKLEAAAKARAL